MDGPRMKEGKEERRRVRKKEGKGEIWRDNGPGSNSLGGRRQALLALTQHRRLKSIGRLGEHIIWTSLGLLGEFCHFTLELINLLARRRIGVRLPLSAGSLGGKRDVKCVDTFCPEDQKGKAPPFSYTTRPRKMPPRNRQFPPLPPGSQPKGGPFLQTPFPTNYMDRTSSPKVSPAVLPFPADHHKQSLYPPPTNNHFFQAPSVKQMDEIDAVKDSGDECI